MSKLNGPRGLLLFLRHSSLARMTTLVRGLPEPQPTVEQHVA